MSQDLLTSYAAIIKQEKQDDGSLMVYGKATDDTIDSDNQICDAGWLAKAMPEWFKTGGNIREQHSNIAAGVAKELDSKDDGFYINTLIVDPVSVKKVEAGVLNGFSIGIRGARVMQDNKAANGRIVDGSIVEISLVDRPANPNAKLMLAKADKGEVIQVEELVEQELPVEETSQTEETSESKSLAATIKALAADTTKFDQDAYDQAIQAIATLISTEAQEMATQGSDERDDIDTLLHALKHLFNFYAGETEEGETPDAAGQTIGESLSGTVADAIDEAFGIKEDSAEVTKGDDECECDCDKCSKSMGCDSEKCKCMGTKAVEGTLHKSETITKCLECGCNQVGSNHGLSQVIVPAAGGTQTANVSTATIVDLQPKSSEPTGSDFDTEALEAVIEKAIKSASDVFATEVELLKAEHSAVVNKLETELAETKALAVPGGPRRTGKAFTQDNLMVLAAQYRQKAAATDDSKLASGYLELAEDFESKTKKQAK